MFHPTTITLVYLDLIQNIESLKYKNVNYLRYTWNEYEQTK